MVGAVGAQLQSAAGASDSCDQSEKTFSVSDWLICVLCILGLCAIIKFVYGLTIKYVNEKIQNEVDRRIQTESSRVGQATAASVAVLPDSSAKTNLQEPLLPVSDEPMYVTEPVCPGSLVERVDQQTSSEYAGKDKIYYFKCGEVYHTELACHYVRKSRTLPMTRRLCSRCQVLSQMGEPKVIE